MRRLIVIASSLGSVAVAAGVASAQTVPPPPVSVTVKDGRACVTVSLQVPQCAALPATTGTATAASPAGPPYIGLHRKGDQLCYDPTPTSEGPCV